MLVVDQARARPGAALDVVHEARTAEALVADELPVAAAAHREGTEQQVERLSYGVRVGIRAEIMVLGAAARAAPADRRPGPLVIFGEHEERVALVVPKPDVEARLVLLDEAVLEHQGLDVVADLYPLDAFGAGDHLGRPRSQSRRVLEIVGEALAQGICLTDVYDPPVLVAELVRARGVGDHTGRRSFKHCPSLAQLVRLARFVRCDVFLRLQCAVGSPKPSQDHHSAAKSQA